MHNITRRLLIASTALLAANSPVFGNIILQLGPGGAASLLNSSPNSVVLEWYSIDGINLSPTAWDSLDSQGFPFTEISATSSLLAEQASAGGLLFGPGESRSIGRPFMLDLAADINADGVVNATDLTTLVINFGQIIPGGPGVGDLDNDGDIDTADLLSLLNTFGRTASYTFSANLADTETSVPEAGTTLTFLALGVAGIALFRRKLSA